MSEERKKKILIVEIVGTKAKEVNTVTNPKMGKRHTNYESMLKTWDIDLDPCDGFCCGKCSVKGCEREPLQGRQFYAYETLGGVYLENLYKERPL